MKQSETEQDGVRASQPAARRSASRRNVLRFLLGGSLAALAAPVAYAVLRFLRPVPVRPAAVRFSVDEFAVGAPKIVKVGFTDAWVLRRPDGNLLALNMECTHTGCTVRWRPESEQFHCPCHAGEFDDHGRVLQGPPRRPLEELHTELDGEHLTIIDEPAKQRS